MIRLVRRQTKNRGWWNFQSRYMEVHIWLHRWLRCFAKFTHFQNLWTEFVYKALRQMDQSHTIHKRVTYESPTSHKPTLFDFIRLSTVQNSSKTLLLNLFRSKRIYSICCLQVLSHDFVLQKCCFTSSYSSLLSCTCEYQILIIDSLHLSSDCPFLANRHFLG